MKTNPMNTLTPMRDQRRAYDAPRLEICRIRIEQGFAISYDAEHEGFDEDWDDEEDE